MEKIKLINEVFTLAGGQSVIARTVGKSQGCVHRWTVAGMPSSEYKHAKLSMLICTMANESPRAKHLELWFNPNDLLWPEHSPYKEWAENPRQSPFGTAEPRGVS